MELHKKYFEIINLLLIDKFEEDEFDLNIFIQNHRNVILKILDDELLSKKTFQLVNFLIGQKKASFAILYLELLSTKYDDRIDLKHVLASLYYEIKQYQKTIFHLNRIPRSKINLFHLIIYMDAYYASQDFDNTIKIGVFLHIIPTLFIPITSQFIILPSNGLHTIASNFKL